MPKALIGALLLTLTLIAFALPAAANENEAIDNVCFTHNNPELVQWAGLCLVDDDWTAGWYVYQHGCLWTWRNRPHLRTQLTNKGRQSCYATQNTFSGGAGSGGGGGTGGGTGSGADRQPPPPPPDSPAGAQRGTGNSDTPSRQRDCFQSGDSAALMQALATTNKNSKGEFTVYLPARTDAEGNTIPAREITVIRHSPNGGETVCTSS